MKIKGFLRPVSQLFAQVMVSIVALPPHSSAAPEPPAESRWEKHNPDSKVMVDHGKWQGFLRRYLDTTGGDGVNRVRYGKVSPKDKAQLESYLACLQNVAVSELNRNEQMAFWINVYNAATITVVLRKYPIKSIRDIRLRPGQTNEGPWDEKLLVIEGMELTLNDIENRILRPLWKDNRVHFALNCASIGCPNLSGTAFTRGNLESQLTEGARKFVGSTRGIDWDGNRLTLSSLFDWYKTDFGGNETSVLKTLSLYAAPDKAEHLKKYSGNVAYQYDWKLNESAVK